MNPIYPAILIGALAITIAPAFGQGTDKSKRPSPPETVTQKLDTGPTLTISYSSPALKGRTIGKDVEPNDGKVWRAGANEATVFETDKELKIDGKSLPAGKYALFVLKEGGDWTFIFNKVWQTWGAFQYEKNKGQDALRVTAKEEKAPSQAEHLNYTISKAGKVSLAWGPYIASFTAR